MHYSVQIERRASAPSLSNDTVFPILGPISPLVPRSMCVGRSGLPCTSSRESPSPPPLLLTTQQTTATSRQSPLKILLRTHVRIRIHVSALDAAAVSRYFCEKKNLFLDEKDRQKEETRASLHDFVSRCACMETKVRRGTLSGRGMEKE